MGMIIHCSDEDREDFKHCRGSDICPYSGKSGHILVEEGDLYRAKECPECRGLKVSYIGSHTIECSKCDGRGIVLGDKEEKNDD